MTFVLQSLGVFSSDFIPRGARFGPIVGDLVKISPDAGQLFPVEASSAHSGESANQRNEIGRSLADRAPSATLWKVSRTFEQWQSFLEITETNFSVFEIRKINALQ